MKRIDSQYKMNFLENFLSPCKAENEASVYYLGRVIKVETRRCLWFIRDIFLKFKFNWRNDQYIAYQVSKSSEQNIFTRELSRKLAQRNVITVERLLKKICTVRKVDEIYKFAKKYWNDSKEGSELPICLDIKCREWPGYFNSQTGIHLNPYRSEEELLFYFLFALLTAANLPKILEFEIKFLDGKIKTSEEYADELENMEFLYAMQYRKIMQDSVDRKEGIWTPQYLEKIPSFQNPEEFYRFVKANGHYRSYQKDYLRRKSAIAL